MRVYPRGFSFPAALALAACGSDGPASTSMDGSASVDGPARGTDAALGDPSPSTDAPATSAYDAPSSADASSLSEDASGAGVDGHSDDSSGGLPESGAPPGSASVLEHHNGRTRSGLYVDPALTRAAAAAMHRDATFKPALVGEIHAQPLFVDGGSGGRDLLLVATEQNWVYALDTTGAEVWHRKLAPPVPLNKLPCGNIGTVGVTGTPIVDPASRTMYLDAMTTPDGGGTKKHLVYALSIDTGHDASGWPLDVSAAVPGFTSAVQNQRSALALAGGNLFVPYGGHAGDCGNYHGWVVTIPVSNPAGAKGWATSAGRGGIWSAGGLASDGTSMYVSTGNTAGATKWGGGEAVLRLPASTGAFSGQPADYFTPADWQALDGRDGDVGSSNPVLVDLPGGTPSRVLFQIGKPTTAWLLDPANLGGIGHALAAADNVTTGETATAPVSYTTPAGTYVAFQGPCAGGDVTALKITPGSPPRLSPAWCATQNGGGALAASTTDGQSNFIVWGIGGNRLRAFDADTGAVLFNGGGPNEAMNGIARFQSPIVAKASVYVGANGQLFRFR